MIKAVVFDMDGVIIDSEPIHYQLSMQYFSELGLTITDEEYYTFVGVGDIEIFTRLKEKYGLKQTVNELVEIYQKRYTDHLKSAQDQKPIKGIDDLIRDIHQKGLRLALGSSAIRSNIEVVLEKFNLRQYFDDIVGGSEVERSKPFPDIYLEAARRLGVEPSECIVIEDSCNGVTAAKAAGMKSIAYYNPNSGEQDLSEADRIIDSFEALDIEEFVGSLDR